MPVTVRISKKPNYIIVTQFESGEEVHYWKDEPSRNKNCDVGIWRIKYKVQI
jgi:hypothetical protein